MPQSTQRQKRDTKAHATHSTTLQRAFPLKTLGIAAAILVLTAVAYLPAFRATYVWDDSDHLPQSNLQRSLLGLKLVWFQFGATPQYYPLTHTTFWMESNLWGLDPTGYHVVNIILHAANAVLLWRVLRRLDVPGPLAAALIFALHPVHVESVAWISERKNVQSGFFYLAAALVYLRFAGIRREDQPQPAENRKWWLYAAALLLFLCAVFSKTVTSTLPAALVLVLWWKHRLDRRQALLLAPMFAIALVMARVTAGMEQWNVGAVGHHWNFTFVQRCLIAGRALWFYAGKLVWPHPLIFTYPRWNVDPQQLWQFAFPIAAVAVVAALWLLRKRFGRGPLIAVLFFCGTLFPALGFVDVYPMRFSFVADHFQYLASIGLIALGVAIVTPLLKHRRQVGYGMATFVCVIFGVLTFSESTVYRDAQTIWTDTLAKNESAWMAHVNLGAILQTQGDFSGAEAHYARALELEPDQVHAHLQWATLLEQQGNLAGAEAHYRAAEKLEPQDVRAIYGLGQLAARRGDTKSAVAVYERVLAIDPKFERARLDLAVILQSQGRTDEALRQMEVAAEYNPYSIEARKRAASILFRRGNTAEAIALTKQAQSLGDDSPQTLNNLGAMLMQLNQPVEAASQFRGAIERDPNFAEAHFNLGSALMQTGDDPGAIMEFRIALRLKPDFAAARESLVRLKANP